MDALPLFSASSALASESSRAEALEGIDTTFLKTGAFGWVQSGSAALTLFRLDTTSTETADGYTVVAPLTGPGRWLKFSNGLDTTLYATQFGADPTGTEDSTAALNDFLYATGSRSLPGHIPAGTYKISGELYTHDTVNGGYFKGGCITGAGRSVTKILWDGAMDDGSAMMVWSRQDAEFGGVLFAGNYKATYGLIVQNAQNSKIGASVEKTLQHGIGVANSWPNANLVTGLNEECVLDRPRVDYCGYPEIQQVKLNGTGLGGTFTLTFDGNTTGGISATADAATVAAALLAANPDLDSPPTAEGGTGSNPFDVTGSLDTTLFITLRGRAAGHHDTVTMDTSLVTGTITVASTGLTRKGYVANGIHFFDKDDPQANADNGTMAIFEPACRQNSGSGLSLAGAAVKVWGGHFEGNIVYGIHLKALQPSNNGYSLYNMLHWPYFENNYAAPIYANYSTRDWIALGYGDVVADAGADVYLKPGANATGGIGIMMRGATGYMMKLGTGAEAFVGQYDQTGATKLPIRESGVYDLLNQQGSSGGAVTLDGSHNVHEITLDDDIVLSITNSKKGQQLTIAFVRGAAAHTVTWPGTVRWAGGVAPTLGTGAAGSADIITFVNRTGVFYEVSRALAVA